MMRRRALQPTLNWAEDTALLRSNRSADPVAETEERAATVRSPARASSSPLRDRHQSVKPLRQDAANAHAGCNLTFANSTHPKFQSTLNQHAAGELNETGKLNGRVERWRGG